jgi:hypothetical protein
MKRVRLHSPTELSSTRLVLPDNLFRAVPLDLMSTADLQHVLAEPLVKGNANQMEAVATAAINLSLPGRRASVQDAG